MRAQMSLHAFLTRLVWLCVGPLIALAIYMAIERVRDVQGNRDREAAATAATLASSIDQDLNARVGALKMLAASPLVDDPSRWKELYQEAQGFRQSFGSHVILADLKMQMLFNTRVPYGTALPTLPVPKGRAAAPTALQTGLPAIGDLFQGPIAKEPLVAIAVPVLRDAKPALLLLTVFEGRHFQTQVDQAALRSAWSLALLDGNGAAIARRAPPDAGPAGDVDAGERFATRSAVSPWSVVLDIPRASYLAPLWQAAAMLALIVVGATLAGVVGGTLAGRRLGQMVTSLARRSAPGATPPAIKEIRAVRELLDEAEQKHEAAEATLRKSAALYQNTLDNMLEACQIIDFDWRYRYVNAAGARQNRLPAEVLIGRTMMETYPGLEDTDIFATLQRCMLGRIAQHVETEFAFPDGARSWLDMNVQPAPEGIVIFSVDISERRRAQEMHRRLTALVESSDDAIIGKSLQGLITSWNPGAEKLFGYTAAEAIGAHLLMLIPPERRAEEPTILARIARGESVDHFETVRVRKDGSRVDVSATISPIRDAQGHVIGASKIARDITDRKLAQARLQGQLDRLNLLDQITRAIGERQDLQSIYQVVIRSLEDRLPVDFACVCRHDTADHSLSVICAGARAPALSMEEWSRIEIDQNGLSRCVRGELVHEPDVDAVPFPFAQRIAAGGMRSLVLAPLQSENRVFGILVVARLSDHAFSSSDCEFLRQLSTHVALAARQAELHDALQQAYDDLRQTQQAVMQQERLRALGQMASGIAHDINNAISPVALYTESLLEREPSLSERGRSYLVTIARAIDDVAATVARMREFYRQREPQLPFAAVNLNLLVQQVVELTRARWSDMPQQRGAMIVLESRLAPDLPATMGVESEIREALINLVFNAVDAMPDGGTLTLRTHRAETRAGNIGAAARCVVVEVVDTGTGMAEDTRRRCLEPFFTTKGERGTGLGLAMVYGITQRHGADVDIFSAVGRGTTVRLIFPIPTLAPTATAAALAPHGPTGRLRILIVDDDPLLLKSLCETLELDGHDVVTANGGQAGIDAFIAVVSNHAFDLVITDLGMPYVDGRKVASAVKSSAPATPVILLTGWGQRLVAEGDAPAHVDRVLSKPPKLREVRAALAQLAPRPDSPSVDGSIRGQS